MSTASTRTGTASTWRRARFRVSRQTGRSEGMEVAPMAGLGRKFLGVSIVVVLALGVSVTTAAAAPPCSTASGLTTCADKFADGATYLIEKPANWNQTLLLYSHGYVRPGSQNPAQDV